GLGACFPARLVVIKRLERESVGAGIERLEEPLGLGTIGLEGRSADVEDFVGLFRLEVLDLLIGEPAGAQRCFLRLRDKCWDAGHCVPPSTASSTSSRQRPRSFEMTLPQSTQHMDATAVALVLRLIMLFGQLGTDF